MRADLANYAFLHELFDIEAISACASGFITLQNLK
jgi:hypothetical protein